jgi:hypothetical protein
MKASLSLSEEWSIRLRKSFPLRIDMHPTVTLETADISRINCSYGATTGSGSAGKSMDKSRLERQLLGSPGKENTKYEGHHVWESKVGNEGLILRKVRPYGDMVPPWPRVMGPGIDCKPNDVLVLLKSPVPGTAWQRGPYVDVPVITVL